MPQLILTDQCLRHRLDGRRQPQLEHKAAVEGGNGASNDGSERPLDHQESLYLAEEAGEVDVDLPMLEDDDSGSDSEGQVIESCYPIHPVTPL